MTSEALLGLVMQVASLFVIACCIFLISSLLAGVMFLAHHKYVTDLKYRINNKYLVFHAISAVCASIVVTVWLSLPHSPRLPLVFKHCHSSNCATHIPAVIDLTLLNLLFAFFAMGMLTICFILIKTHQKKLEERINSLLLLSRNFSLNYSPNHSPDQDSDGNYRSQATIIDVPQPVLLNVGMLTPKILLSSQITESLSVNDVKILLAYEYAKAKQFENIKVKLVQITCLFWLANARRLLITDLHTLLRTRAFIEIRQLFKNQATDIPKAVSNKMTQDLREFVSKMEGDTTLLPQYVDAIVDDADLNTQACLASFLYFICLVSVTSNFTHFLFEIAS
jgi:hypothetical protein